MECKNDSHTTRESQKVSETKKEGGEEDTTNAETTTRKMKTDEEGLHLQYDVILYGTGLVESIVASALARAGKSILHCDASDHYGSFDAVWPLSHVRDHHQQQQQQVQQQQVQTSTQEEPPLPTPTSSLHVPNVTKEETNHLISVSSQGNIGLQIHSIERLQEYSIASPGTIVTTQYGMAKVDTIAKDDSYAHCTFSLTGWTLTNGSYAKLHLAIPLRQLTMDDDRDGENNNNNNHRLSTLKNPQDWNQDQLQRLVDRYYARQNTNQCKANDRSPNNKNRSLLSSSLLSRPNLAGLQSWHESVDHQILDQGRSSSSFALDVSPGLLFAWGPAVQGLLQSSVADYVEFKSLEQLLYNVQLQPVPCSKNDVFSSSLLTPMEKRRLMKFLQLALDYGLLETNRTTSNSSSGSSGSSSRDQEGDATAAAATTSTTTELSDDQPGLEPKPTSEEAVTTWNERHLNQGRSLARPQNKAVTTEDMAVLQQCLAEEEKEEKSWDFERYLKEKHRLSPSLVSLVRHALALEPIVCNTSNGNHGEDDDGQKSTRLMRTGNSHQGLKQGMQRLCRHMQALGRFGTTAFLVPLYGSGELAQAFCRSAAVYGATYLLRRSLSSISIGATTTTSSETDKTGDQVASKVTGVWIQPPQPDDAVGQDQKQQDGSTNNKPSTRLSKHITCAHVIVPDHILLLGSSKEPPPPVRRRVLRRISILRGKPFASSPDEQQRLAWVLPPDHSTNGGNKIGNLYTMHGLVLDESAQVAPYLSVKEPRVGCSVVHLSTVVDVDDSVQEQQEVDDSVLKRAMETILAQQGSKTKKSPTGDSSNSCTSTSTTETMLQKNDCQEIFHVSFSFPLFNDYEADEVAAGCQGLHVVHRPSPGLVLDTAFEQAKDIFQKICPNQEFLVLATELDTLVKERFGDRSNRDEEDDEKRVLESAMDMIQQPPDKSGSTKDDVENEAVMTGESSTVKQAD